MTLDKIVSQRTNINNRHRYWAEIAEEGTVGARYELDDVVVRVIRQYCNDFVEGNVSRDGPDDAEGREETGNMCYSSVP